MGRAGMLLPGPCHTPCDTLHMYGMLTWEDFPARRASRVNVWPLPSLSIFPRLPATWLDNAVLIV